MKLHDLRPADGSRRPRTRVGRGIAAGQGKTAGRGTKGQKARAGGSIPPWFEGGQTPLHQRIPKLRGFRNPFKTQYEVVNVGRIGALVAAGRLEAGAPVKGKAAPITVNQEILRATGLVSTLEKPLKVLGHGEVDVALFVVADAFTRSARAKIEAAGGTVQVIEMPSGPLAALGVEPVVESAHTPAPVAEAEVAEAKAPVRRSRAKAPAAKAPEAPADAPAESAGAAASEASEPGDGVAAAEPAKAATSEASEPGDGLAAEPAGDDA
jgi:large subunit ribosomal protein L15